jgi:Helix-hairpin-helix motif
MLGNASGIDLNNASEYQLSRIGGIGRVLAARIIEQRPIRKWSDLEKIEGFDREMVNDLRGSGAKLGKPGPRSTSQKPYSRVLRPPKAPQKLATRGGRLSKNIFSGEGEGAE